MGKLTAWLAALGAIAAWHCSAVQAADKFTGITFLAPSSDIGYVRDLHQALDIELHLKGIGYSFAANQNIAEELEQLPASSLVVWPRSEEQLEELAEESLKRHQTLIFVAISLPQRLNNELNNVWSITCPDGQLARRRNELIESYLLTHPDYDRNHNGRLDFILLRGRSENPEEENRTHLLFKLFNYRKILYSVSDDFEAQWNFKIAYEHLKELLDTGALETGDVEMIIASSDDMALGALGALTEHQPGGTMPPTFGIDGISEGLMSVRDGVMQSVKMDLKETVHAILEIYAVTSPHDLKRQQCLTVAGRRVLVPAFALNKEPLKNNLFYSS